MCSFSGKKIQMTSPVIVKIPEKKFWERGAFTMSFLLPAEHQMNPPKPNNDDVSSNFLRLCLDFFLWSQALAGNETFLTFRFTSTRCQKWTCMCWPMEDGWQAWLTAGNQMNSPLHLTLLMQNTQKDPTMLLDITGNTVTIFWRKMFKTVWKTLNMLILCSDINVLVHFIFFLQSNDNVQKTQRGVVCCWGRPRVPQQLMTESDLLLSLGNCQPCDVSNDSNI